MSVGAIRGNVDNISLVTATFDVASVAANTSVQQSVTVLGVKVGDFVTVANTTHTAGLQYGPCAVVTAADTVAVTIQNSTAGALDPASQTLTFLVCRPEFQPVRNIVGE